MSERRNSIDCRRAHELLSEQMDSPLSPADELRLQIHLEICTFCVRMEKHFRAMREAMRRLAP